MNGSNMLLKLVPSLESFGLALLQLARSAMKAALWMLIVDVIFPIFGCFKRFVANRIGALVLFLFVSLEIEFASEGLVTIGIWAKYWLHRCIRSSV